MKFSVKTKQPKFDVHFVEFTSCQQSEDRKFDFEFNNTLDFLRENLNWRLMKNQSYTVHTYIDEKPEEMSKIGIPTDIHVIM